MSQEAQTPEGATAPDAAGADSPAPIGPDAAAAAHNPLVSPDAPVREQRTIGAAAGSSVPPASDSAPTVPPAPSSEPPTPLAGPPAAAYEAPWRSQPNLVAKLGLPEDRPEVVAGAAFGAGLVVALILKRLAR